MRFAVAEPSPVVQRSSDMKGVRIARSSADHQQSSRTAGRAVGLTSVNAGEAAKFGRALGEMQALGADRAAWCRCEGKRHPLGYIARRQGLWPQWALSGRNGLRW